jgi:hypothetical protein
MHSHDVDRMSFQATNQATTEINQPAQGSGVVSGGVRPRSPSRTPRTLNLRILNAEVRLTGVWAAGSTAAARTEFTPAGLIRRSICTTGMSLTKVTSGTRLRGDTRWAAHAMSSYLSGGSVAPIEELLSRW